VKQSGTAASGPLSHTEHSLQDRLSGKYILHPVIIHPFIVHNKCRIKLSLFCLSDRMGLACFVVSDKKIATITVDPERRIGSIHIPRCRNSSHCILIIHFHRGSGGKFIFVYGVISCFSGVPVKNYRTTVRCPTDVRRRTPDPFGVPHDLFNRKYLAGGSLRHKN
jgi:hypothetical protein